MKRGLVIVDIQNDFLPGGALAVPGGDSIIPYVVNLIRTPGRYDLLVATQDYHPADHGSFASSHEDAQPFDVGQLGGIEQVFWPDHCVAGTSGAEIAAPVATALDEAKRAGQPVVVIQKGKDKGVDSYSGFFDNNRQGDTGLHQLLTDHGITAVDLVGLALDYCVQATATDAVSLGYATRILLQGTRAIEVDRLPALRQRLENRGIALINE